MKINSPNALSVFLLIALYGVPTQAIDSNSTSITYSNFPSETAVAKTEGSIRILHSDRFDNDSLHRIWGCSSDETKIEDGVLKAHSLGGPNGKLKVSIEPFTNGELRFRFKLGSAKGFGFGFDDLTAKDLTHGGHLIGFNFSADRILVKDTVTGIYNMEHYEQYKEKKTTLELEKLFDRCQKEVPFSFSPGRWYRARISISGVQLELSIDDKKILEFQSLGIAHPRKDMYRFNVGKGDMEFDDVSLTSSISH